jgi:MYXO-CTERM domain-containing protein
VRKVIEDWKARLERYNSVRYTLSGSAEEVGELPVPEHLKNRVIRPPGPKTYPKNATVLIDFVNGRIRLEETSRAPSRDKTKWVSEHRVTTYDGKTHRTSLPRDRNDLRPNDADLGISRGNLATKQIDTYLWPVFMAHGLVPIPSAKLRVDRLPRSHDPEEFTLSGSTTYGGRACLILQTDPSPNPYEIWVDPGMSAAIPRYVCWDARRKNPTTRLDIRHREADGTQPLPESWTETTTVDGKVVLLTRMKVDRVEPDVPLSDSDFTIPVQTGMLVHEYEYPPAGGGLNPSMPSQKAYRAGKGGIRTPEGEQRGFTTLEGVQLPPESDRRWIWWSIGLALVALLVGGLWAWRRRRPYAGQGAEVGAPQT